MAKWIYDGDCLIATCCGKAFDIERFEKDQMLLSSDTMRIFVPKKCPNCGTDLVIERITLISDMMN